MGKKKQLKKQRSFDEILKTLNPSERDFDPNLYLKELVAELRREEPRYCTWCLIDYIYSSKSDTLIPFFVEVIQNSRDYYKIETATDWLLKHGTEAAKLVIRETLPTYLNHPDPMMRDAAIRGLRNLDTKEVRTFLWNARTQYTFASEEETEEFQHMIEYYLAQAPQDRAFHIIP